MSAGRLLSIVMVAVTVTASAADTSAPKKAPTPSVATQAPAEKPAKPVDSTDRLALDATTVTGNRELPKVMYIIPWKKAELGQLPGQPFNSLLNEVLQPVDRDVFRRQVNYYQVVAGHDQASPSGQPQPTSAGDSK